MNSRSAAFLLLAALLAAAFPRLVSLATFDFIDSGGGSDSVTYLALADNLSAGRGYTEFGRPHTVHHPLYPLAIAAARYLVPGPAAAAKTVSCLAGVLLIVPVFFLAASMFGLGAGLVAGLLAALCPLLVYGSVETFSESLYTLMLWLGLWSAWGASRGERRFLAAAGAGAGFALAFLTHPMGVIFVPFFAGYVFAAGCRRRRPGTAALSVVLMVLVFAACALPFWARLHRVTGEWQLSGSSHYRDFGLRYEQGRGVPESRVIFEHMEQLFGPGSPEPAGGGERESLGMAELIVRYPGRFLRIVGFNLEDGYAEALKTARFLGLPPWLFFAALGAGGVLPLAILGYALVRRRRRGAVFFLALVFLPMAVFLVMQVEHRYFYPFIPGALILLSWPLASAWPGRFRRWGTPVLAGCLLVFAGGSGYVVWRKAVKKGIPYEYRLLGDWMRRHLPDMGGERVMMFRLGVSYYAGCEWNVFYWGDYPGLVSYLSDRGIWYLVIDSYKLHMIHPSLRFLLTGPPPPEFEVVHETEFDGRRARLLRFKGPVPEREGGAPAAVPASAPE